MIITIPIEVTQEDIAHGKAMECRDCPLALAASRIPWHRHLLPPGKLADLKVTHESLMLTLRRPCGQDRVWYPRWPDHVTAWIKKFDNWQERPNCKPFTVDLEVDTESFYTV